MNGSIDLLYMRASIHLDIYCFKIQAISSDSENMTRVLISVNIKKKNDVSQVKIRYASKI